MLAGAHELLECQPLLHRSSVGPGLRGKKAWTFQRGLCPPWKNKGTKPHVAGWGFLGGLKAMGFTLNPKGYGFKNWVRVAALSVSRALGPLYIGSPGPNPSLFQWPYAKKKDTLESLVFGSPISKEKYPGGIKFLSIPKLESKVLGSRSAFSC